MIDQKWSLVEQSLDESRRAAVNPKCEGPYCTTSRAQENAAAS